MGNKLNAVVKGSKRHFNAGLDCKMNFNIAGEGPNWGTYSISRDVKAAVSNHVIHLTVTGDASFTKGVFEHISPVQTDVDLTYKMNARDLVGKFSKVMKGKKYSIDFPAGSFVMPKFTWGQ